MSGSGGGGGGGGGINGVSDCASIVIRVSLNSPDPAVVRGLSPNDVLDLSMPDTTTPRILAVTTDGHTAGSVTTGRQAALVACIREGFTFIARVVSVAGGDCEVEIRPKAGQ